MGQLSETFQFAPPMANVTSAKIINTNGLPLQVCEAQAYGSIMCLRILQSLMAVDFTVNRDMLYRYHHAPYIYSEKRWQYSPRRPLYRQSCWLLLLVVGFYDKVCNPGVTVTIVHENLHACAPYDSRILSVESVTLWIETKHNDKLWFKSPSTPGDRLSFHDPFASRNSMILLFFKGWEKQPLSMNPKKYDWPKSQPTISSHQLHTQPSYSSSSSGPILKVPIVSIVHL